MANAYSANVQRVESTADFSNITQIKSIKYIGAAASSALIKSNGSTSGEKIWEESSKANVFEDVCIKDTQGVRVEITGTAVVYLYLE